MESSVLLELEGAVATLALNRPANHNAFNREMVAELSKAMRQLSERADVRVIVLTGRGRSFSAGADLSMMRATGEYSFDDLVSEGKDIFDLMQLVDACPKPVIGRINGAAVGGGCGLVSCCDIVVAVERARFGFSEVRLGLIPAVISPFVVAKVGTSCARELFLTGELFDAKRAQGAGLVHHVTVEEELDAKVGERVRRLLEGAPGAQAAAKRLIARVSGPAKEEVRDYVVELLAHRRSSAEGREGMSAFLEKRRPRWEPDV